MSSARNLANRANAQLSTGPQTPEGRQASKYNATRHGLSGKQIVVAGEDPKAFEHLFDELVASYKPANAAESTLVEEIAQNFWRLQRARRIEAETFNIAGGGADPVIAFGAALDRFDTIRRYMTAIERAYHRAIAQLEKTQSIRRKEAAVREEVTPAPAIVRPTIGFVSQTPEPRLIPKPIMSSTSPATSQIRPISLAQKTRSFENCPAKSMTFLAQIFLPAEFPNGFGAYKRGPVRRTYRDARVSICLHSV